MKILKLFSVFLLLTLLTFSCQQEEVVTSLTESKGLQAAATQGVDEIAESIRLKEKTLVQSSPTYTGPSWIYFNKGNSSNNLYRTTSNDGITWGTTNPQIPRAQTSEGPGAAYFNNNVFTFFRGVASNKIYYSYSSDGSTWNGGNTELGNGAETSDDPAAVSFKGNLFLFYRGKGGTIYPETRIYYSVSGDGFNWTGNVPLNVTGAGLAARSEPAVTTDGVYLYLLIRSDVPAYNQILLYRSADGINWSYIGNTGESTDKGVAVSSVRLSDDFYPQLYMVYKGESTNNLLVKKYNISFGTWGSSQQILGAKTRERPSLATDYSKLVVLYKGNSTDNLFRSYTTNGNTWTGNNQVAGQTNRGPAVLFTR
jgi:hypothetical protein